MMTEKWSPAIGFEGVYSVSTCGRVRRDAPQHGTTTGRILRPAVSKRRYLIVRLSVENVQTTRYVHDLVAQTFLGPKALGIVVRHINGDELDNRIENLTYGTQSDNVADMVAHGRHHYGRRTHCNSGHEFTPENTIARSDGGGRRCRACRQARQLQSA